MAFFYTGATTSFSSAAFALTNVFSVHFYKKAEGLCFVVPVHPKNTPLPNTGLHQHKTIFPKMENKQNEAQNTCITFRQKRQELLFRESRCFYGPH